MDYTTETSLPKPSSLEHSELEEEFDTLNPSGTLLNSEELNEEMERIIDESAAEGGRLIGTLDEDYVRVELLFSVENSALELGVFTDE